MNIAVVIKRIQKITRNFIPQKYYRVIKNSFLVASLFLAGCTPHPDIENNIEIARVFGECVFVLNRLSTELPIVAGSDQRLVMIQAIVDELTRTRYSKFPWKVHVQLFDAPIVNAFSTGGGFMGVYTGIYAMTDDEAGLAGVLAHELAHMTKDDFTESLGYLQELTGNSDGNSDGNRLVKSVLNFCMTMPGMVSRTWEDDLVRDSSADVDPSYGDLAIPYVPYTYSEDPDSPYFSLARDPNSTSPNSSCDNRDREVFDEFLIINPDYYLETYPNYDSLPPIPEALLGDINDPSDLMWILYPWRNFQLTSFSRYIECQSDEVGLLNLLATGYNPRAINESFDLLLELFDRSEADKDWRFKDHPSLAQRIEDNIKFFKNNADVLPSYASLIAPGTVFSRYIIMADRIEEFENIRDKARDEVFGEEDLAQIEPITLTDIALALAEELSQEGDISIALADGIEKSNCSVYKTVFKKLTGKERTVCFSGD
ncbi:MAG: M48 family metallopeptidase [Pseudomonadales bacterium]|nr:M48 family metallopeptidase [Pseudomonadales bacterium]